MGCHAGGLGEPERQVNRLRKVQYLPIYFYSKIEAFAEFSNFAPLGIEMDGLWWPTVEHYFQAQKFHDADYREKIRKANTPKSAKALGRTRKLPLRSDWEEVKVDLMRDAILKKFETHDAARTLLLSTGDEELIENSLNDYFWGGGRTGTGQNMLGRILMEVRTALHAGDRR